MTPEEQVAEEVRHNAFMRNRAEAFAAGANYAVGRVAHILNEHGGAITFTAINEALLAAVTKAEEFASMWAPTLADEINGTAAKVREDVQAARDLVNAASRLGLMPVDFDDLTQGFKKVPK